MLPRCARRLVALAFDVFERSCRALQAACGRTLLGGQDLQIYRIEREEADISRLIKQERAFWRGVELDQAPPSLEEGVPMR